ncbi:methyltransf-25 domain-containing protein [Phanerochaete sordida]|uniref:Methyltransf-25 domain-containing protein n=1 Tax=Phanerochaete sordida TaxID=48140 RepID=A0A9P3LAL5_9APHY|nr:methyltransf-25 domain-containing protein [Phanerochaete sordida]
MLAPYPTRLRSHSSPAQPERSTPKPAVSPAPAQRSAFAAVEEVPELQGNSSSSQSSPHAASHNPPRPLRLKRPSDASPTMALESAPPAEPHIPPHAGSSSPTHPRPPRPLPPPLRRVGSRSGHPRPSSSAGPRTPEHASAPGQSHRSRSASASGPDAGRRESPFLRGLGPIMGAGTDFMLQRRKSRGGRQHASKAASTVQEVQEEEPAPAHRFSGFSTPDRTVLQELRRRMQERDGKFVVRNGKKHHPYGPDEVPYPRSYERNVVDSDIWECMWASDSLRGRKTWYVPDNPPAKVLDIGCGSGSWILDCAIDWKDTHFVGLDIVPLQPDLAQIGSPQLASRIRWVEGNFLEKLPFPDEEFDFVHAKRIARGVPEDKWDSLLEEVQRVLRPGGVFGLFDEELTFPGKFVDRDRSPDAIDLSKRVPAPAKLGVSEDPAAYSSRNSSLSDFAFNFDPNPDLSLGNDVPSSPRPQSQPAPKRPRTMESSAFSSALSLGLMSPTAMPAAPVSPTQLRGMPRAPAHSPKEERHEHELLGILALSRPEPKPAFDPRDHSLLEYIYNEMHASRFINLEPLALLENTLSLVFKDVFTHPPIILTYPPRPPKKNKPGEQQRSGSDPAMEEPEYPPPVTFKDVAAGTTPYVMFDGDRMTRRQPRSAQGSGPNSGSTSASASPFPSRPGTPARPARNIVPLTEVLFDHRALNMHLQLRVQEVLACGEAMWHFVLEYQERHLDGAGARAASPVEHRKDKPRVPTKMHPEFHDEIMGLYRREFDGMLTRFRLDMEEHTFLASTVNSRLCWPYVRSPKPPERVEFEELCEKWEKHIAEVTLLNTMQSKHGHSDSQASVSTTSRFSIVSTPPSDVSVEPATPRPGQEAPIASMGKSSQTSKDRLPCPSRTPHPSERISRMCRAFVAWK